METTTTNKLDIAKKIIGTRPLCGVRHPSKPNQLRFFVATDQGSVAEVTQILAAALNLRTTKGRDYIVVNAGYNPVQYVAELYGAAVNADKSGHPYSDMK